MRTYLTTSIPYVNASPHLGFALELVQADALARSRRRRGQDVRLFSGTDDNSLSNVLAAEAAGVPTADLVDANAARFVALQAPLDVRVDDFLRTSRDPRHRAGVERLWAACAAAGDLYRGTYDGAYCVGCEAFLAPEDLADGRCPDHGTAPEHVVEENWFFRLSRYQRQLEELIEGGGLRIVPEVRRREVVAFVRRGLRDFSISRSRERARGWGIPVPGDPEQVVYVWWDALASYVNALGYGTDAAGHERWWGGADERVHVIGKGILRFHAVCWPAMLLSAGEPLPSGILVHEYVTAAGRKLSKSRGGGVDPAALAGRYGADAVRWWLLREVAATADTDFTEGRLVEAANRDLANGVGNLVNRTVAMVHRYRAGRVPAPAANSPLAALRQTVQDDVAEAVDRLDFRAALAAIVAVADAANRLVSDARPWELAAQEQAGDAGAGERLDATLAELVCVSRWLAAELEPFVPGLAGRLRRQLDGDPLPPAVPLFPRLDPAGAAHAVRGRGGGAGDVSVGRT